MRPLTEAVSHRAGIGTATGTVDADPITTEVIRHGLDAAADQMRIALRRTAFSPVIYEMTDFAAALYDRDVRLLAQAQALPLFLGTLSFCIETAVEKVGGADTLEPGDVIFSTYGYDIGSHQQDATIVVPAFFDDELVGYAAIKAHHMDIGAKEIYCTDTVDVFQEGAIFPSVRLYRRGELQHDMYRTILANSRLPHAFAGDLNAQVGAARVGLAGLDRLIAKHGLVTLREAAERMFDHGETVMRRFFETIPDGRYSASGVVDDNGIDDEQIEFEVAIEVSGSDVCLDFTGSPPEQAGPMNCPLATTVSAARIAIMTFAGGNESANEGHFRPIEVRTIPGTLFHPRPPAPIFMYAWPALQAVDVIHKALADALPSAVPAGNGGDLCCVMWWGKSEDGTFWGDGTDHYVGQGATAVRDGAPPLMHISCSGIRNTPIEVLEARRPLVTERFEYVEDSAGAGRFRGGLGVAIHYRVLTECYITSTFERTKLAPWGLHGGLAGVPNLVIIRRPDGSTEQYGKVTALRLEPGSVIELRTGAGGGFGPPSDRPIVAVRNDLLDGYISEAAARRHYPHAFEGS
jgi:N-methylhydantoinase B